jgi:hypothetical protein
MEGQRQDGQRVRKVDVQQRRVGLFEQIADGRRERAG